MPSSGPFEKNSVKPDDRDRLLAEARYFSEALAGAVR
jgi:hypothetical protein